MSGPLRRILAVSLVLAATPLAPAQAVVDDSHQLGTAPRGWSAIEGSDAAALIGHADSYGTGGDAAPGDPYCDASKTIARTLSHDFGETLVQDAKLGRAVTQLWGSDLMGTWTLVMARDDEVSCVIASGIGFRTDVDPRTFYVQAGLTS